MQPQKHDVAIISELFNTNNIDSQRSSVIYDDAGYLIKLSLHDAALDKSSFFKFPASFSQLTHLRELYIYVTLTHFPIEICQLTNLQAFVLSSSKSAHDFPSEFAQLSNLRYLGLGNLKLQQVPHVIWQLHNLRVLDLSWNQLTNLPSEVGQLTQLQFLYLMGNHLLHIPATIGQLTELEVLDVWPHKLETLPNEIAQLHKLHWLSLSQSQVESIGISHIAHEMGMYVDPKARALLRRYPAEQRPSRYLCACCGYSTIEEDYDICPICFWESDPIQQSSLSSAVGANKACLIEASLNFARARVSEDRFIDEVRSPLPEEIAYERNSLRSYTRWSLL